MTRLFSGTPRQTCRQCLNENIPHDLFCDRGGFLCIAIFNAAASAARYLDVMWDYVGVGAVVSPEAMWDRAELSEA